MAGTERNQKATTCIIDGRHGAKQQQLCIIHGRHRAKKQQLCIIHGRHGAKKQQLCIIHGRHGAKKSNNFVHNRVDTQPKSKHLFTVLTRYLKGHSLYIKLCFFTKL